MRDASDRLQEQHGAAKRLLTAKVGGVAVFLGDVDEGPCRLAELGVWSLSRSCPANSAEKISALVSRLP
jgi:hypothetical protein